MGIYGEYLDAGLGSNFEQLVAERKRQLARIAQLRGRDLLVYAADFGKNDAPISIDYSDLLPLADQLANLNGTGLDVIIETPGGSGEVAEDMVRQLRDKYSNIAFIIPGHAKSAGTIIVMSGDDILMGPGSALGPIDAQLFWQGKVFSAEALLEGFKKIQEEVVSTGMLNKAYIPILQGISPGELQAARNHLDFAKVIVREWLVKFKFKDWNQHKDGTPVTAEEKEDRANEIGTKLAAHNEWKTHGRSLKIEDLRAMRLKIIDYTTDCDAELSDAISRYHVLLQMTFASNIYKVFETPTSQIYRMSGGAGRPQQAAKKFNVTVRCSACQTDLAVQGNFVPNVPLDPNHVAFPADNRLTCPKCGNVLDLTSLRQQAEAQVGQPIVT